jgi:outer membrane lipoprotein-sorting protein
MSGKGKNTRIILAALLCLASTSVVAPAASAARDLRAIIEKAERQYWGESSRERMTMRVVTERWTRTLSLEAWSEGKTKFLARILEPAKDRGVTTLKVGEDIWNYLPKVDRVIKVPSSMMGESWMGSHITNDDLVKESDIENRYDFRLLEETATGGETSLVIEATPKPDAAVVWGKVVYTVREKDSLPTRVVYHDESGGAVREIRFEDLRVMGGRLLPSRMTVLPYDKPGERTEIVYETIEFGLRHPDGFFSLKSLPKR